MIDFLIRNKEIIIILSGIGTFISALIAIFTLREVKNQRLAIYKPEVLIKSFIISISKSPLIIKEEELIKYKFSDFNDYSINSNNLSFEISPRYKVENLGFGIAKQVKCEWNFNIKKAIKMIENIMPEKYSFNYNKNLNIYFLTNSMNTEYHYSSNANIYKNVVDYIPPINIQQHFHFHTIPSIIVFTHYLFLIFKKNLLKEEGDNFNVFDFKSEKFPSPILKISYKDLNNKRHKRDVKFKITAVDTQIDEMVDLTKEFAYLLFEIE